MFSEFFTYCFMHVTYSMVWSFNNCNKKCFKNCIEKLLKKGTAVMWELLQYSCINYSYKSNMYDSTSYKMSISGLLVIFSFPVLFLFLIRWNYMYIVYCSWYKWWSRKLFFSLGYRSESESDRRDSRGRCGRGSGQRNRLHRAASLHKVNLIYLGSNL